MAYKQQTGARTMGPPLQGYVHLPPPVPDFVEEPVVSGSFLAPEDIPLAEEELRSAFSNRSARVAELVREAFSHRRYGRAHYRLRIDELDEPGAKDEGRTRQRLALVSRKDSAHSMVAGWVDVPRREAQVRSYAVVAQRYRSRHGCAPVLSEKEYKRFLGELIDSLFNGGIKLVLLVPEPRELTLTRFLGWMRETSFRSFLVTTFLVVLAFALGMNVEHLPSWIAQVPSLIEQVPTWGEQMLSWIRQVPSWIEAVWGFLR